MWCMSHRIIMRPIAEQTVRLSVSLNKVDHDTLQRVADKNDVSVAWVVRKAVERFLDSDPQGNLFRSPEMLEGRK